MTESSFSKSFILLLISGISLPVTVYAKARRGFDHGGRLIGLRLFRYNGLRCAPGGIICCAAGIQICADADVISFLFAKFLYCS